MTEKRPRSAFLQFTDRLIRLVDGVKGIVMILAALSIGGASGTVLAGSNDTAVTDSLKVRVTTLEEEFAQARREAMEMYSIQIEADSTLRIILEGRAANRRKAREARADTEKLFKDATGGKP